MPHRLDNYLRSHRRRSGLSQDEVAFLLGSSSGTKVARHEGSSRRPGLETLFAYEVIYGVPARELFAGVYERVERATGERARSLALRLSDLPPHPLFAHKIVTLKAVYGPVVEEESTREA